MKNAKIILLLIISCISISAAAAATPWIRTRVRGTENVAKLNFYVHDVRAGPNATTFEAAVSSITSTSSTSFGQIKVYDDRMTAEPDINSEEVGRAQGLATSADLQDRAVTMSLNFLITSGEFNGTTISLVGWNQVGQPSRELSVVGGTGVFRYARGYAVTTTYYDTADYSILVYTVYATYSDVVELWTDM